MRSRWFANDDLQIEVLSRLPTKAVREFKSVSKEWKQLLSDRSFIKVHSMRVSEPVSGFFFEGWYKWRDVNIKSSSYVPVNVEVDAQVHRSVLQFLPENVGVVASTNGLICCRSILPCQDPKIYVCNPLNKEWVSLEFPTGYTGNTGENVALAFSPLQNAIDVSTDFKLVRVCQTVSETIRLRHTGIKFDVMEDKESMFSFDIYSSRTKVWRKSAESCRCYHNLLKNNYNYDNEGVFAEGMLFWLTVGDQVLMFDPEKELSSVFMGPLPASRFKTISEMCIGESENKLHYVGLSEHGLQMWVLQDWFASEWELKHSIAFDKLEEENPELLYDMQERMEAWRAYGMVPWMNPMAFKDGLVVMRVSKDVFSYHFETRKLRKLARLSILGGNFMLSTVVLPYVMRLVPLGQN